MISSQLDLFWGFWEQLRSRSSLCLSNAIVQYPVLYGTVVQDRLMNKCRKVRTELFVNSWSVPTLPTDEKKEFEWMHTCVYVCEEGVHGLYQEFYQEWGTKGTNPCQLLTREKVLGLRLTVKLQILSFKVEKEIPLLQPQILLVIAWAPFAKGPFAKQVRTQKSLLSFFRRCLEMRAHLRLDVFWALSRGLATKEDSRKVLVYSFDACTCDS